MPQNAKASDGVAADAPALGSACRSAVGPFGLARQRQVLEILQAFAQCFIIVDGQHGERRLAVASRRRS